MSTISRRSLSRKLRQFVMLLVLLLSALAVPATQPVQARILLEGKSNESDRLLDALTVEGIVEHLQALQAIAEQHGNNRAAGTPGHGASVEYLVAALTEADYQVTLQPFTFDGYVEIAPPKLALLALHPRQFKDSGYTTLRFSGSGQVTAPVQAIDISPANDVAFNTSTSGCEQSDFVAFQRGNIALLQRGTCPFSQKVRNAVASGASAVLIFNEGQPGRTELFSGTLGETIAMDVPVLATSYAIGRELLAQMERDEEIEVFVRSTALSGQIETVNVLAETRGGDPDNIVMVGGHFDSVQFGPGINDNGSGTATLLEVALEMAELDVELINKVRFAFWSAEELGLLGSKHYVEDLRQNHPELLEDIALYLNFDMIGSPNYLRGVYQMDDDAPVGTSQITQVFVEYFNERGLHWEPITIGGRSDHAPFMREGIAVGGLFSGAENRLSPEQAQKYGHANERLVADPCYHQACDTVENVNPDALDELGDAAAHAILTFAADPHLSHRWSLPPASTSPPTFRRYFNGPY